MSTPFVYPMFKGFDTNGVPLAGGLLYTYEAGTDTPLALYEDYNFSTAHDNPIVLSADGEALIYSKVPFKALLKDSDGVTIDGWPVDNLEVPPYHSYLLIGPTIPATPPANTIAMYAVGTSITYKDSAGVVTTPITSATIQSQSYNAAAAGGTANAITATFTPTITALTDKLRVTVTSSAANTGAVTFAPDSLAAKAVLDSAGTALAIGAIAAANIPLALQYVQALDSWILRDTYPAQYPTSNAKFWAKITGGTAAIVVSYNVASTTDAGVGLVTITFTTAFSTANWCALAVYLQDVTGSASSDARIYAQAAGTVQIATYQAAALADVQVVYAAGFGDQ